MNPEQIARELSDATTRLRFAAPVTHVYNPLDYARKSHEAYLERFAAAPKEVLFLGMNPGPWGMAQTGVPFGDVTMVRGWLGIQESVDRPAIEHPKRPVEGFSCLRNEVSGTRLWGWARERFGTPDAFFKRFFIWNYCPLAFMEASGRNRTPDKLPASERAPLFDHCDRALYRLVGCLRPQMVIGIGKFAESRARTALERVDVAVGHILHPSPASPAANKGWAKAAEAALAQLGIDL